MQLHLLVFGTSKALVRQEALGAVHGALPSTPSQLRSSEALTEQVRLPMVKFKASGAPKVCFKTCSWVSISYHIISI